MTTQRKLNQAPPFVHKDEKVHRELIAKAVADLQTRLASYVDAMDRIGAARPDFIYSMGQW